VVSLGSIRIKTNSNHKAMAQANLVSVIAKHNSLLITLRDDHTRLGNLLKGDSLATVMGPAVDAGVKESTAIADSLRASAVLQAMTKDMGNQEQLFVWLAEAIQGTMRDTGHRASDS
jgi:hypothetical protein